MKVIELGTTQPTLAEVIREAADGLVVLRKPDGSVFALSQVGDFDVEVEMLRNNTEFMAFMKHLAEEKAAISIQDLRTELGL